MGQRVVELTEDQKVKLELAQEPVEQLEIIDRCWLVRGPDGKAFLICEKEGRVV